MRALRPIVWVLTFAALDLGSKAWAVARVPADRSVALVPGLFDLSLVHNRGIALSTFADMPDPPRRWVVLAVPLVVTVLLARLMLRVWARGPSALRAGFVLVLGGAVGNLVDRALDGAVVDFVRFRLGERVLFTNNLADDFISVGAVLLALGASSAAPERPAST